MKHTKLKLMLSILGMVTGTGTAQTMVHANTITTSTTEYTTHDFGTIHIVNSDEAGDSSSSVDSGSQQGASTITVSGNAAVDNDEEGDPVIPFEAHNYSFSSPEASVNVGQNSTVQNADSSFLSNDSQDDSINQLKAIRASSTDTSQNQSTANAVHQESSSKIEVGIDATGNKYHVKESHEGTFLNLNAKLKNALAPAFNQDKETHTTVTLLFKTFSQAVTGTFTANEQVGKLVLNYSFDPANSLGNVVETLIPQGYSLVKLPISLPMALSTDDQGNVTLGTTIYVAPNN